MSLKQVPASDSYQLDFLNKKAKEIESRKRKAKDILSGIEKGIKEREKLTVLLETKSSLLEEDVTVLFREAYDALSVYGDIYIETDEKGRALCQIAESDSLPCIREIRETDGIKYIPGTAADVLDIIDQCSFRYEPEDWTVGRSAEEEIKTGIARLKAGGCAWTSLYDTRLEAEIEMLRKTDTEGYFLTVYDILRHAEEYYPSDPFYPGLLVSYVLGITDIDPICNDILTKLSEETFVAGIHHPRFMIRPELSDSLYKKIREKYAVSRISKDTIVIGYPDIRDYVPVCRDRIQCDRDEAEKMGLFCMDLEEQEYLSIFKDCISSIQDPGIPIDPEVFKNVIAKGHLKADAELRLYGEYIQDRYGNTFSVKEAYPVSDDVYYISAKVYEEAVLDPFRRRCGCQLFLMEPSGRLVNTGCLYSSRIADVQGVRMIPKI